MLLLLLLLLLFFFVLVIAIEVVPVNCRLPVRLIFVIYDDEIGKVCNNSMLSLNDDNIVTETVSTKMMTMTTTTIIIIIDTVGKKELEVPVVVFCLFDEAIILFVFSLLGCVSLFVVASAIELCGSLTSYVLHFFFSVTAGRGPQERERECLWFLLLHHDSRRYRMYFDFFLVAVPPEHRKKHMIQ